MSNSSFGLYNGNDVGLVFGALPLDDMRADEFVRVTPDADAFGDLKGSNGGVTRWSENNTMYTVAVTLKRSSKVNAQLSAIFNTDDASPGGAGVQGFGLVDPNGTTFFTSEVSWIKAMPEMTFGKEVGSDVVWMLRCQVQPGSYILGGNQL